MAHIQEIPSQERVWEHLRFEGRRIGLPGDDNPRRFWGVIYAPFASENDANAFPDVQPLEGGGMVPIAVRGNLVDRFFWDATLGQYTQTEAQVGAMLLWFFTDNPTAEEFAACDNIEYARRVMAGTQLFDGAITVLPLPAERKVPQIDPEET